MTTAEAPAPNRNPRWPQRRREVFGILTIGGPLIIHNLALMGMQFTDTLMAGRLGAGILAAVAVGANVWSPVFLFLLGILMALSPTAAHLHGAGRDREIGRYVRQMAWLSLLLAALGWLALWHAAAFLRAIHIEPPIIPTAAAYLRAMAWGLPGVAFTRYCVSPAKPSPIPSRCW